MIDVNALDFSKGNGLVTIVTQDSASGAVLMVAHADREAVEKTIETGEMHYRSRSRGLWRKGQTSGNTQRVVSLTPDCDGDSVLARVVVAGPACHTGAPSCFGGEAMSADVFGHLSEVIESRAASLAVPRASDEGEQSDKSYTRRLLSDRNLRLKKIGEEAAELVTACADNDRERAIEEAADVIYHTLVALRSVGAGVDDIRMALARRETSTTAQGDGRREKSN
jgi:phosphoribosyl-AMP cyclohydrolase / phosphoribosyl-ATP pyrophosphohydrolase